MMNIIKSINIFRYYKKILKFLLIFFVIISVGFLLGNHFSWEGKKGFYLEQSKTFYTYMKKKYYVQKSVNPLNLNSKNIEIKDGEIPNNANKFIKFEETNDTKLSGTITYRLLNTVLFPTLDNRCANTTINGI